MKPGPSVLLLPGMLLPELGRLSVLAGLLTYPWSRLEKTLRGRVEDTVEEGTSSEWAGKLKYPTIRPKLVNLLGLTKNSPNLRAVSVYVFDLSQKHL